MSHYKLTKGMQGIKQAKLQKKTDGKKENANKEINKIIKYIKNDEKMTLHDRS